MNRGAIPKKQEIPMKTEPQKEHQWLQRLVGEWTYESECSMEPGKPPEKFEGSESVRSLGGSGYYARAAARCPAEAWRQP
jgi:hypothetical protein